MIGNMWAQLATWVVQDGQLPEIGRGSLLPDVGLSVSGVFADPGHDDLGLIRAADQTARGAASSEPYPYLVSGVASEAYDMEVGVEGDRFEHAGAEFILDCGELRFQAVVEGVSAASVAAGQQQTLLGVFEVLADHEDEVSDLDLTTVARDWIVIGLQVQRYQLAWTVHDFGRGPVMEGEPAGLLDRVPIERVDAWPDEQRFATEPRIGDRTSTDFFYLLELEPAMP